MQLFPGRALSPLWAAPKDQKTSMKENDVRYLIVDSDDKRRKLHNTSSRQVV